MRATWVTKKTNYTIMNLRVVVPENPLSDDEVDGVFMDMDIITPPSSSPVYFLNSWTNSER